MRIFASAMKEIIKQTGIFLWVAYFFLSTTGISLQRLYCHCADKAYVSLFEMGSNCNDHYVPAVEKSHACCSRLQKTDKSETAETTHQNCCNSSSSFIKADIKVLFASSASVLAAIFAPAQVAEIPFLSAFLIKNTQKEKIHYRPPPRKYGISLRHFLQSYLC